MAQRLAGESSPYLLQHADNPVDWYPWGEAAFARARAQDKPIFLSIGYAACHWCHVMAHESFENQEIAALMNDLFVNIKVDREERPDVDAFYMNAIQVTGEGGGWPLSAFCTPDGKPYYLGTYFPPVNRYGRPGFPRLLQLMAQIYREQRDQVERNTDAVMAAVRQLEQHHRRDAGAADPSRLEPGILVAAGRSLAQHTDPVHGGFGDKPKFPSSSAHDLLGRAGRLSFGEPARRAFVLQAKAMCRGGICDHLGGGFARYAVDQRWLVPHFEKMLYDNGQLLGICADAFALTGDADYLRVIDETLGWLEREMLHPSGGLYASQDADSEGQEGKYYVWTPAEIEAVLGEADAAAFARAYGVTEQGNFEGGATVLSRVTDPGAEADEKALAAMRTALFAARSRRIPPQTDTKILAGWNALAVAGLVRAWEATGSAKALDLGRRVAEFLAAEMVHQEGSRLWRVFKDGQTKLEGTLDDYAFAAHAFFRLAEALEAPAWWQRGRRLLEVIVDRFYEEREGVGIFYMTPRGDDQLLVHRPESNHDGAIPSGAAVAVECLLRAGRIEDDAAAFALAEAYLAGRALQAQKNPFVGARLLAALDLYLHGAEVVISEGQGREALLAAARRAYAPTTLWAGPFAAPSIRQAKPPLGDGRAAAYVCRGQTCSPPIAKPDDLAAHLHQTTPARRPSSPG